MRWIALVFFILGVPLGLAVITGQNIGSAGWAALVQVWGCSAVCVWGSWLHRKNDAEWKSMMDEQRNKYDKTIKLP
jgi:hypothetical protein